MVTEWLLGMGLQTFFPVRCIFKSWILEVGLYRSVTVGLEVSPAACDSAAYRAQPASTSAF